MQSKFIFTALLGASFALAGCSAADEAVSKTKDAATATADKAKKTAAATADKTGELTADAKAGVKNAANDAGGSAKTYGDKAAAKADDAGGSAKTYAKDKVKKARLEISSGNFSGRSDHVTTGKVRVMKSDKGYHLVFGQNFSLDGAPDPIVALGNGGVYDKANKISVLKNKTGRQVYALPASFTPGEFSEVYVWCEKFNVPLGIANLTDIKS